MRTNIKRIKKKKTTPAHDDLDDLFFKKSRTKQLYPSYFAATLLTNIF